MSISDWFTKKQIAGCLTLFLTVTTGEAAAAPPQQTATAQQAQSPATSSTQSQAPASPTEKTDAGTEPKKPTDSDPPDAPRAEAGSQSTQPGTGQSGSEQQNGTAKPLGTAVAPYEKILGVTASRPAGAVIAPAKQRRRRAILISVGVVVGAGVAIGTVAALSRGSSSRPN